MIRTILTILLLLGGQTADRPDKLKQPPAIIEVAEADGLKLRNLQLDAQGRRARADAMNAQAIILNQQAAELEKQMREMFVKVCKALGVNPDDYDGQFGEKGLTLVRKEAATKP